MSNPRASLPPSGVSGIDEFGNRKATGSAPAPRGRGRRVTPGEDPLKNPDAGRQLGSAAGSTPAGVTAVPRDVREFPAVKTKRPMRRVASWTSADGNTYNVRTHRTNGEPLPYREVFCLMLSIIEMRKGGDPLTVFDAFKMNLKDMDGQPLFPVPEHLLVPMGHVPESIEELFGQEPAQEEEDDEQFGLAGD